MIYLVGSHEKFNSVKTLVLNEIVFKNFSVDLKAFNALVITSKNAINALKFNKIQANKNLEIYAIGSASAKAASEFGFSKIYTAKNSHGNEFAREISPLLKGKKTLFLKAAKTASNVAEILTTNDINLHTIIAYENMPLKLTIDKKPPKNSVIIFNAPSAVKNFIANFGWQNSYKAVAIGNTTAKELENFCEPKISISQNITECIKLAKTLL